VAGLGLLVLNESPEGGVSVRVWWWRALVNALMDFCRSAAMELVDAIDVATAMSRTFILGSWQLLVEWSLLLQR